MESLVVSGEISPVAWRDDTALCMVKKKKKETDRPQSSQNSKS